VKRRSIPSQDSKVHRLERQVKVTDNRVMDVLEPGAVEAHVSGLILALLEAKKSRTSLR
jgi:hypothetical protein